MTRKTRRALKVGAGTIVLAAIGGLFAASYFSPYETCLRGQMEAGQLALLAKKFCSEQQAAAERAAAEGSEVAADSSATPEAAAATEHSGEAASAAPQGDAAPPARAPSPQQSLIPGWTRPPPI